MNFVGKRVIMKNGEKGTIIVKNSFQICLKTGDGKTKQFASNAFEEGLLKFEMEPDAKEYEEFKKEERINKEKLREEKRIKAEFERSAEEKKRLDRMFGKDFHAEHMKRDCVLTCKEVEERFRIKRSPFGKGINLTPEGNIVLISSKSGNVYNDRFDGEYYIYTGEGQEGDQKLTKGNKDLVDAMHGGCDIFLLIKRTSKEYYLQGRVKVIDYYLDDGIDSTGSKRKEYKFKLDLIEK